MKPNKPFKIGLALVACSFAAASSNAATMITILNHSFEDATNTSWQIESNGSTAIKTTSGVIASAAHDTPPDGSDTINHSNGQSSHQAYQVLGATLTANTTYTLTVDVGDRTDLDPGGPVLRLGTGTTYGANLLAGTVVSDTTPVNGAGASDGWETWITTFTTGATPTGLGDALRVELRNDATTQALFDNVRLDASPVPEPSTTALLGLGGLALILRRRK